VLEQQQLVGYQAPLALGHQRPLQLDRVAVPDGAEPPNFERWTHGEAG
jgi:hypothetical protein